MSVNRQCIVLKKHYPTNDCIQMGSYLIWQLFHWVSGSSRYEEFARTGLFYEEKIVNIHSLVAPYILNSKFIFRIRFGANFVCLLTAALPEVSGRQAAQYQLLPARPAG